MSELKATEGHQEKGSRVGVTLGQRFFTGSGSVAEDDVVAGRSHLAHLYSADPRASFSN